MHPLPTRTRAAVLAAVMVVTAAGACGRQPGEVVLPDCLDTAALYALVGPESIGLRAWDEAVPLAEELGSRTTAGLPDAPLTVFGPGEESGTFDSFAELAIEPLAEARQVPAPESLPRPDYISSPNDNVIVDGVAGTPGSLGWVGQAYVADGAEGVRAFEIAAGDGPCVAPEARAIAAGRYPLARDLFAYVSLAADGDAVSAYVDTLLGPDGLEAVEAAGYVRLPDGAWAASGEVWTEVGGAPGTDHPPDLTGSVVVSGSSTVEPISSLVAERFSERHPSIAISVDGPGTGDGFEQFCDGEVDVTNASRPIEDEEAAACADAGIGYVELRLAIDGLSVVTAATTPAT